MTQRFVAIGECMLEMTEPSMQHYKMGFAGDSFNTAYYLAHLSSQSVYFASAIGSDPYSQQMLLFMQDNHIQTNYLFEDPHKLSGLYFIKTDETGERRFYYYRENAAAKAYFSRLNDKDLKALSAFDNLYATGISLAVFNDKDALINLFRDAKSQQRTCYFDNNYRERLWDNSGQTIRFFDAIHPYCDILFVTYDDEALLYGDTNIEETIHRYKAKQLPLVVIKQGNQPTILLKKGEISSYPTPRVKHVVDTTAAGDSFNAGFIKATLEEAALSDAINQAQTLASQVIQYPGALIPKDQLLQLDISQKG